MLIASHLSSIINLISTNPVVSVVSPTGSGKSVGIPAAIAATGAKCFVSVPTRTAAISLAEYQRALQLAQTPNLDVNKIVGYAAESKVHYTSATMIAYVTGGHARRKMLQYFSRGHVSDIDFCDVLMVDEVHSGSVDTTIIISLWMKAAASQVRVPRLVIASATPVPMIIEPIPQVYTVELPSFPIDFRYLAQDIDIDDPMGLLYVEAAKIAADIHRNTAIDTGHILIFAPGSSEVESIAAELGNLVKSTEDKIIDIIPAFGALKPEDIALIYKQTGSNERKVVIATNIAEMSITIVDVGHVIDTMVEKRPETSLSGGFRLTTHYISKDSAKQRAGRTGRTRPGTCHRMCTLGKFSQLEEHRPPEIERVPIYETVMELLDVGLSPETVIKGIDIQRVVQATLLLNRLGMITNTANGVTVTDMGHFAPKFHLSVRNAAFLWHWINFNGHKFSSYTIKLAHELVNINLEHAEIDETSEYMSIKPHQMVQTAAIFETENLHPFSIIDATANIGGDIINFFRLFPHADIKGIEIDPAIARILRRNFENLGIILGTTVKYHATAINMSAIDYFKSNRYADMIFFDPPWISGRDYKLHEKVELTLDNQGIGIVIGQILKAGMTPLVVLKAPFNVDYDMILSDVGFSVVTSVHNVYKYQLDVVDYQLIFIRSVDIPLLSPLVMKQNIPAEVSLVSAQYPVFPGIVAASLIDSYGPSYFWIPRRKPDMDTHEYNLMVRDYKIKNFGKYIGYNDLETCLNMWSDLMASVGGIDASPKAVVNWARSNSINNKKIRELLTIVDQSVKAMNHYGRRVQVGPFTTQGVMKAARPLLLSVYSDTTMIHGRDLSYFNPMNRENYRLDNRDAVNTMIDNPPKGVIALVTAEISAQRGVFRVIGFGVDTDKDGLGRPIIEKEPTQSSQRGPRAIIHQRQPPVQPTLSEQSEINSALDLLSTLNISNPTPESTTTKSTAPKLTTPKSTQRQPSIIQRPPVSKPPRSPTRYATKPVLKSSIITQPRITQSIITPPVTSQAVAVQQIQPNTAAALDLLATLDLEI
jgi:hypothetical protein